MERRTLRLLALFAALLAAYLLAERVIAPRRAAHRLRTETIIPFRADEVAEVRLASGTRVLFGGGGPRLVEPVDAPADPAAADALLRGLLLSRWERRLDVPADSLAAYGLDPPRAMVAVQARDGRAVTLDLGAESVAGKKVYMRAREGGEVGLVSDAFANALFAGADAVRERRLVAPGMDVGGLRIERPSGVVSLSRDALGAWRLEEPVAARASGEQVSSLVARLTGAEAIAFLDDALDTAGLALETSSASRRVTIRSPRRDLTLTFQVRGGAGSYLIASGPVQPRPVIVGASLLDALDVAADSLRETRLFRQAPSSALGIEMALGADTLVIEREPTAEEGWRIVRPESIEADPTHVRALIRNLEIARIEGRAAGAAPRDVGLDPPRATLRLRFAEPPREEAIAFGLPVLRGAVRAAWEGEDEIFLVSDRLLDLIVPDPAAFEAQRLLAGRLAGADRITMTSPLRDVAVSPRELRRERNGWRLFIDGKRRGHSDSPDLEGAWTSEMYKRLESIEALDRLPVVGSDSTFGFTPPGLVVEWDGPRAGRFEVGAPLDPTRRFARLSDRRAIYLVSAADIDSIVSGGHVRRGSVADLFDSAGSP